MNTTVTGWKHSSGDFNGNKYNYVLLYAISNMEQKENQRGRAGIEIRGVPELVEKLQKIDFSKGDVLCEIETENRAIGKGQSVQTVVSVKPKLNQTA